MKIKRIYLCENSIEGIFTGIYLAWESRYGHENIQIQVEIMDKNEYNMELFAEYIDVKTDHQKALKVASSIQSKISEEAFSMVCHGAWSDDADKGDVIYRFLILGFSMGKKVVNHMSNESVMKLFELDRNVSNEAHHFLGFLRFVESAGNILLAKICPKNDILRIIAPHFTDRLATENFVIYDENRKTAVVHRSGLPWIYTVADTLDLSKFNQISENEEEFTSLWHTFFETIAIDERRNNKLQQNNLPKRFRNHMTEFL